MIEVIMLKIVYEDSDILVCHKKSGELSQSDRSFSPDLVSQVLAYRKKKGEDVYAAIINRLDRPVEGLVLFAKNKTAAAKLSAQMQQDTLNKKYYALVYGEITASKGTLENYIYKDSNTKMAVIADNNNNQSKIARLDYEVISHKEINGEKATLLRIHLHTGRFHQIRAQFAHIGHPLVGDTKYGTDTNSSGVCLCAYALDIIGKHIEIIPENTNLL